MKVVSHRAPWSSMLILFCCGVLAFFLNVANFNAVKEGGPLMMNVVGNVKQVAMIFISRFIFGNKIKPIGYLGSVICICGSMWYTYGNDSCFVLWIENMKASQSLKVTEENKQLLEKKEQI